MSGEAGSAATVRGDLLALNEDALTALGNRGLVKRAVKELAGGLGASIGVSADGAVEASYPDGVTTVLPAAAALAEAACSCAAPGLCRHRVGLVLAYQEWHGGSGPSEKGTAESQGTLSSPADIDDVTLGRVLGARSLETARRQLAKGFDVVVHRAVGASPARVELPTCTVTFLVPDDPSYATTDAAQAHRAEAVVLAVWGYRASIEAHGDAEAVPAAGGVRVHLGASATETAEIDLSALAAAAEVVDTLLLDGTANAGPLLRGNVRHLARELDAASMLWPAAVLEDLADQADWYAERSARHEMRRTADLISEFHARHRAAARTPASARAILGTAEPRSTPLKRVRLVGLGCRIAGGAGFRTAELFFAHPLDGTVLVLRRTWPVDEEKAPTIAQLRSRRVAGSTLHHLAAANLVSEVASRSASRVIDLNSQSIAKTAVMPVGNAWRALPESLVIRDFNALLARLARRGPRLLCPRVAAEDVFVLAVRNVEGLRYDPAEQRLEAFVVDEHGTEATIAADYSAYSEHALNAVGQALSGGEVSCLVSGTVTVQSGRIHLRPLAIWRGADTPLVVPDLAETGGRGRVPGGVARTRGKRPLAAALDLLDDAADLLVEHAHRGVGMLAHAAADRVHRLAHDLGRHGLSAVSALLDVYAATLVTEDRPARARAWVDCLLAVESCR
ncbi:hypothetical protein [Actinospica robiniae]|uniref:hypothetical protein n=1 Tax=Actinospica robiniae TaxID=304901 RepID=UPI000401C418|nr:hypothetical protein [Actinospica robiniae]